MKEDQISERRSMNFGDWCNSAVNVVIGLLLGSVVYGLMQLITTGAWAVAIVILVGVGGIILLDLGVVRFFDWLFPPGIRTPRKHYEKAKAPLTRLLSLPLSFVLGAIFAHRGLDSSLLQMVLMAS